MLDLLLADGRFPSGGFAHSAGLEAAVACGAVVGLEDLAAFVAARVHTAGALEAWLAVQAHRVSTTDDDAALARLDAEADAHQPSPVLREAARRQGRGMRRAAARLWPSMVACPAQVAPVVLGACAAAAGLDDMAAARIAVHNVMMTLASAAPKLMAVDITDVLAIVIALEDEAATIVTEAVTASQPPIASAPLVELRADRFARTEGQLFAS
ncbi:MAG: urease accessory protein UreF [Acidimicrobiia bacterium]